MKSVLNASVFAFLAFNSAWAAPVVGDVAMEPATDDAGYEITYSLSGGPAVVTLDVECRISPEGGWKSLDGGFGVATGDVSRVVTADSGTIRWFPGDHPCGDAQQIEMRAKVTAWPLDNPPDYMVVSLNAADSPRCTYYERENLMPWGGVLSNMNYRTTHLVMRKILAKGVTWTMGMTNELSDVSGSTALAYHPNMLPHEVTLDSNYYIAVFQTTQAQMMHVCGDAYSRFTVEGMMRPMDGANKAYSDLRGTPASALDTPVVTDGSIIGKFRRRTNVDFDLPTEAQWEFAARAGHGHGFWPDGTPMLIRSYTGNSLNSYFSPNFDFLGRYAHNGGCQENTTSEGGTLWPGTVGPTNSYAIVGSYPPNSWGLYDMCGNAPEWCLDFWRADITALNGTPVLTRESSGSSSRVYRGGGARASARQCKPGWRSASHPENATLNYYGWPGCGFRLAAPCVAKIEE